MLRKTPSANKSPKILLLEDDVDQMDMLINFALTEINRLRDDENISDEQRQALLGIQIVKVANFEALQKAVTTQGGILLALLDCNTPDTEGGVSHDQLVSNTSRGITGQHKSVDIVTKYSTGTPITIISSMDRFQRIVKKYYASKHDLSINFIRKSDPVGIKENVRFHLREFLATVD